MIRRFREDVALALTFMTRLPVPCGWITRQRELAEALWAMPFAGAIVGALGGGVIWTADWLGMPADLSAILAIAVMTLVTGALHEDGLADFCDGLGGGRSVQQRITIMRDSQIGAYGTIAIVLSFAALIVLIRELFVNLSLGHFFAILIAAAAISRTSSAIIFAVLPPARDDGLAAFFGRPGRFNIALTLIWPPLVAGLTLGLPALALSAGNLAAALTTAALAYRYLGGYTGDVLGTGISVSFIISLIAVSLTI